MSIKKKKVYICKHCGNIVESLWDGNPSISCCGEEMSELNPNTTDAAVEKHVPVIERDGNKVTVKVGEVAHPMIDDHYILFIEVIAGDKIYRQDLKAGDEKAEATFTVEEQDITARAFCNKHGFWSSK